MSALDQAFIKAYRQQWPTTPEPERSLATEVVEAARTPGPARLVGQAFIAKSASAYHALHPPLEDLYVSPAVFRVDPAQARTVIDPPANVDVSDTDGAPSPLRPLSSFASVAASKLRPRLEVDRFLWPEVCDMLEKRARAELDDFVNVLDVPTAGGQLLVFAAASRGAGCTTAALAVARRLAARNMNVVLVDVDSSGPSVADALGIAAELGISHILQGSHQVEDALIASVEDRLVILPAGPDVAVDVNATQISQLFDPLRAAYRFVLVDVGPVSANDRSSAFAQAQGVTAIYWNYQGTSADEAAADAYSRFDSTARLAGLIENRAASRSTLKRLFSRMIPSHRGE